METSKIARKRDTARDLCAKATTATLAAAFFAAAAPLSIACAEEIEGEPEQTLQPVESESANQTMRQKSPSQDPPLDGPELRLQKKRDWWNHAQEVLFSDIELSAEQAQAVDAIIEAQLNKRALLQQLDAKLSAANETRNSKRINAARAEFRALNAKLKETHEIYEEMRAVLEEGQRPVFDMNRARHVAEMQESERSRSEKRAKRTNKRRARRRIE